ncbi:MAG TPA: hypothetical protein VF221_11565 [Chloroflexota bacterium]
MVPSAISNGVGVPDDRIFAAQYLAYTYPYQRFVPDLAIDDA